MRLEAKMATYLEYCEYRKELDKKTPVAALRVIQESFEPETSTMLTEPSCL